MTIFSIGSHIWKGDKMTNKETIEGFWWQKEFQYLLDRKILSRDELAYLFGQIKSIVEKENAELLKYKIAVESAEGVLKKKKLVKFNANKWGHEGDRIDNELDEIYNQAIASAFCNTLSHNTFSYTF